MNRKKVVVSHSGKQYVHQLLYALQKENILQLFITSIWYKANSPVYKLLLGLPLIGKILYTRFLSKKTFASQNESLIEQYPWKEFLRQCLVQVSVRYRTEKYVFEVERAHDRYVAKRLKKLRPGIFIGYEKSSLESFKVIKSQGGTTVLDLAQVHYRYLAELRGTEATFQNLFEDEALFAAINRVKQAEYEQADYILTLSGFARSTLIRFGIEEHRIKVMNLGFNPEIFKPKTAYSAGTGLKLIYTGTFTKRKGVHLLLEAVKELDLPGLKLVIIGPVLDGSELLERYKGLYTYYDFMPHQELVRELQAADVYVFPSYLDSWAMTVVEAMACGLPVIITENTGAKDAVTDGESGYIIPVGDKEQLKEKISMFYRDKHTVEKMGGMAVLSARKYAWGNYHDQVNKFIRSL